MSTSRFDPEHPEHPEHLDFEPLDAGRLVPVVDAAGEEPDGFRRVDVVGGAGDPFGVAEEIVEGRSEMFVVSDEIVKARHRLLDELEDARFHALDDGDDDAAFELMDETERVERLGFDTDDDDTFDGDDGHVSVFVLDDED